MADCPHTIGVEFGTRIIEVNGQKIKLQIWYRNELDSRINHLTFFIIGILLVKNVFVQ
jgi:hypothetical protein